MLESNASLFERLLEINRVGNAALREHLGCAPHLAVTSMMGITNTRDPEVMQLRGSYLTAVGVLKGLAQAFPASSEAWAAAESRSTPPRTVKEWLTVVREALAETPVGGEEDGRREDENVVGVEADEIIEVLSDDSEWLDDESEFDDSEYGDGKSVYDEDDRGEDDEGQGDGEESLGLQDESNDAYKSGLYRYFGRDPNDEYFTCPKATGEPEEWERLVYPPASPPSPELLQWFSHAFNLLIDTWQMPVYKRIVTAEAMDFFRRVFFGGAQDLSFMLGNQPPSPDELLDRLPPVDGMTGHLVYLIVIKPKPKYAGSVKPYLYVGESHRPPKWDEEGNVIGGGGQDRWFQGHLKGFEERYTGLVDKGPYKYYLKKKQMMEFPQCRALWHIPTTAINPLLVLVTCRILESLLMGALGTCSDVTLKPLYQWAQSDRKHITANRMSSLAQGVPTVVGRLTPEEAKAWAKAVYARDKERWETMVASLPPVEQVLEIQKKKDWNAKKNRRKREIRQQKLEGMSPSERDEYDRSKRLKREAATARHEAKLAAMTEDERAAAIQRRRELGVITDRRRAARTTNALLAMTEGEREAAVAEANIKYSLKAAAEKRKLEDLNAEDLEEHKKRKRSKVARARVKRQQSSAYFATAADNARRRLYGGVRDRRGDIEWQMLIALQIVSLLLSTHFEWPPVGYEPPTGGNGAAAAREWLLTESETIAPGQLLHPSRVAAFVIDIAAATGIDVGPVDLSLVDGYKPTNRVIWFKDGKTLKHNFARSALATEGALLRSAFPKLCVGDSSADSESDAANSVEDLPNSPVVGALSNLPAGCSNVAGPSSQAGPSSATGLSIDAGPSSTGGSRVAGPSKRAGPSVVASPSHNARLSSGAGIAGPSCVAGPSNRSGHALTGDPSQVAGPSSRASLPRTPTPSASTSLSGLVASSLPTTSSLGIAAGFSSQAGPTSVAGPSNHAAALTTVLSASSKATGIAGYFAPSPLAGASNQVAGPSRLPLQSLAPNTLQAKGKRKRTTASKGKKRPLDDATATPEQRFMKDFFGTAPKKPNVTVTVVKKKTPVKKT